MTNLVDRLRGMAPYFALAFQLPRTARGSTCNGIGVAEVSRRALLAAIQEPNAVQRCMKLGHPVDGFLDECILEQRAHESLPSRYGRVERRMNSENLSSLCIDDSHVGSHAMAAADDDALSCRSDGEFRHGDLDADGPRSVEALCNFILHCRLHLRRDDVTDIRLPLRRIGDLVRLGKRQALRSRVGALAIPPHDAGILRKSDIHGCELEARDLIGGKRVGDRCTVRE